MDDSGRQVFWQADLEGRLHELWRVVIVVQHRAQHCGRPRQRPRAAVTSLDCRQETKGLYSIFNSHEKSIIQYILQWMYTG